MHWYIIISAMKRNLRLFALSLAALFVIGVTGLFMGLVDVNRTYVVNRENVDLLVDEISRLKTRIDIDTERIRDYDYMEFKVTAFAKRFSLFSNILDSVYTKSKEYGFEPNLVLGIVKVESDFNPKAISYKGAYGLMQVNLPVWRKELNIDDRRIFDVNYNIDLGLKILKGYYEEAGGNMNLALHRYNNGYLYNNTAYPGKVRNAVLAFQPKRPVGFSLSTAGLGR